MGCATAAWLATLDTEDVAVLMEKVKQGASVRALHRASKPFGAPGITTYREHLTERCVCDWSSCG